MFTSLSVPTFVHMTDPPKKKQNTEKKRGPVMCVCMHTFMSSPLKPVKGDTERGLETTVQSTCLLAASPLTTPTTRHHHTECTNTNLSVSPELCLYLFIPFPFLCFKPFMRSTSLPFFTLLSCSPYFYSVKENHYYFKSLPFLSSTIL